MPLLAELALRPLRLGFDDRFYPEEAEPGGRFRWTRGGGTITIDNPGAQPREAIFSVTVRTAQRGTGTTTFAMPDGTTETVRDPGAEGTLLQRRLRVPVGRSKIHLESADQPAFESPGDPRRLVAQLVDAVLVPVELCEAATVIGAPDGEGGCLDTSRAHRP